MATTSPNLNLRLPDGPDTVNVTTDLSNNFTKIDNAFNTETPSTFNGNAIADAGTSGRVAKADHEHGGPGFAVPVSVGTANSEGVALTLSRSDHLHKATQYLSQQETFDLSPSVPEDMYVQVPATAITCTLILRGRVLVAGLLPAHSHTNSVGNQSANHNHAITDAAIASTTPTASGNGSSHDHTGSTSGTGSSHNHTITVATDGSHVHSLTVNDNSGGDSVDIDGGGIQLGSFDYVSVSGSTHSHSATNSAEAAHTHTLTIAADTTHQHTISSLPHTHTVTAGNQSANHNHTVTVDSAGSGGTTSATYPQGVTVSIDGTDRTTALGGPFGAASGWNGGSLNILPYISSVGEHYLIFGCSTAGKLKAQVLMSF